MWIRVLHLQKCARLTLACLPTGSCIHRRRCIAPPCTLPASCLLHDRAPTKTLTRELLSASILSPVFALMKMTLAGPSLSHTGAWSKLSVDGKDVDTYFSGTGSMGVVLITDIFGLDDFKQVGFGLVNNFVGAQG